MTDAHQCVRTFRCRPSTRWHRLETWPSATSHPPGPRHAQAAISPRLSWDAVGRGPPAGDQALPLPPSALRVCKLPRGSTTSRSPEQRAFSSHRSGDWSPSLSAACTGLSRGLDRVPLGFLAGGAGARGRQPQVLPRVTLSMGCKRPAGGSRHNVLIIA